MKALPYPFYDFPQEQLNISDLVSPKVPVKARALAFGKRATSIKNQIPSKVLHNPYSILSMNKGVHLKPNSATQDGWIKFIM